MLKNEFLLGVRYSNRLSGHTKMGIYYYDEKSQDWVYIETKKTSTSIFKLGKRNTEKNNILILQLDDLGLIKTKNFYDLAKMNEIEFSEKITSSGYQKNSYVYNLLTSLRHKINSPIERTKSKK
mgnify:CR=1 FL=1